MWNCGMGKSLLKPIHVLEKQFVRMATNSNRSIAPGPLPPIFHKLKLLTICDIYKLQLGNLVYESINGIGPVNKVITFTRVSDSHYHNTRYATHGNFYVRSVRTTRFGLKGLKIEGAKLYKLLTP